MFKHSISLENYILQNSLKERRQFTKLKICAHSLAVETGQYSKPKIPVESRLCQHCNQGVIETEYHIVMALLEDAERTTVFFSKQTVKYENIEDGVTCRPRKHYELLWDITSRKLSRKFDSNSAHHNFYRQLIAREQ